MLELDYETIGTQNREKLQKRYEAFYVSKMEALYKGILKNYSIQLADHVATKERKNEIYEKIFQTLEEYIVTILPIKMKIEPQDTYKNILTEYDKFSTFLAGKLDGRDVIEKKLILLGISRTLFTHSLPLIVAEQCYIKLLKDTRALIVNATIEKKKNRAYEMLITLIEDYNIRLLSTKIYWDKPKQKEILFVRNDLKAVETKPEKYVKVIQFYKQKLVELGVMRNIKNSYKTLPQKTTKKKTVVA